jgi:hypothetical protein
MTMGRLFFVYPYSGLISMILNMNSIVAFAELMYSNSLSIVENVIDAQRGLTIIVNG